MVRALPKIIKKGVLVDVEDEPATRKEKHQNTMERTGHG